MEIANTPLSLLPKTGDTVLLKIWDEINKSISLYDATRVSKIEKKKHIFLLSHVEKIIISLICFFPDKIVTF